MTRRQSNKQWSGGIAAQPAPKKIRVQKSAGRFIASIFWDQNGILLIDYLPKGQTINAEYYSSLLVQMKDIFKGEKKTPWEGHQGGLVLARQCPGSPGTCNPEETGLPGLPLSWSPTVFSGSGPVRLPPVPWTEKPIERSPFFVRRRSHCCRGDPGLKDNFLIFFFFLSGWQKLQQGAKKCIELRWEYVEQIPSFVAVACFLPGRAKDLSALPRASTHITKTTQ